MVTITIPITMMGIITILGMVLVIITAVIIEVMGLIMDGAAIVGMTEGIGMGAIMATGTNRAVFYLVAILCPLIGAAASGPPPNDENNEGVYYDGDDGMWYGPGWYWGIYLDNEDEYRRQYNDRQGQERGGYGGGGHGHGGGHGR